MVKRLILSGYGYHLSSHKGMLIIKKAGKDKKVISVGNLSRIIVNARGTSISGDALKLLLKHNVQVIFLSGNRPIGKLQPMKRGGSIRLKKEQIKAQNDMRGYNIAWIIVLNKISNQMNMLKRIRKIKMRREPRLAQELKRDIDDIAQVKKEIIEKNIGNYKAWYISKEAEAGKIYWKSIGKLLPDKVGFDIRRKRYENPKDPFNIALNYLYSILASEVWFAVELSGLDPYIGYLHKDSNRRPSLVMDLIEEFRQPVVDKSLIHFFTATEDWRNILDNDGRLSDRGRMKIIEIFYKMLDKKTTFQNRSLPIKSHIQLQPLRLAKYIIGYTKNYQPYNII